MARRPGHETGHFASAGEGEKHAGIPVDSSTWALLYHGLLENSNVCPVGFRGRWGVGSKGWEGWEG